MSIDRSIHAQAGLPWWRYRMMWLVVGAPLVVVVASLVTGYIALAGADTPVGSVPTSAQVARGSVLDRSNAPAQQVRNHVVTPVTTDAVQAPAGASKSP